MYARDRLTNLGLFGAAVLAWAIVVVLFTTRSPVGDVGLQVFGASLLGMAFALTTLPLFWLAAFTRHGRIAYRGDWSKAVRRGAAVGLVVTVLVVLRSQGAFSWPLALFIVAMAVFIEIRLSAQG
jgi:hypothetical protein